MNHYTEAHPITILSPDTSDAPPVDGLMRLGFDPAIPCQVTLEFPGDDGTSLAWQVSRELLTIGSTTHLDVMPAAGVGDVRIGYTDETLRIWLSSPEGRALVMVDLSVVDDFLDDCNGRSAPGTLTYETAMVTLVFDFLRRIREEMAA